MNTEAIIEKLLLSREEQILNTPLEDLNLPVRVYKRLWRSNVRTVGDVAHAWNCFPKVRRIGVQSRVHILAALQAWSRSLPNFTTPDDADREAQAEVNAPSCDPDPRRPIEVLHLSPRTYYALKRNRIETLADIYREWDKIASLRNVGRRTLNEIKRALPPPESVRSFADPNPESHPAKNDFVDRSTASDVGHESIHEILTKKYVITDSGVVVNADLLQAEEPRKPRAERWKNVSGEQISAKPQDYAPKNIFQAIGQGQNKISSPIRRQKKVLDGSERKYTNLLRKSLETLEKANRPRKVRSVTCPLCRAVMKSIQFEEHLVDMHPEAFQELQKAVSGSLGWQNVPGVGLVFREPREANHFVKCPLCEYRDRYRVMNIHIQVSHPEVDPGLMIKRFHRVNRSKDYENLLRYKDELNELIREYERLKQAQAEPRDGSQ